MFGLVASIDLLPALWKGALVTVEVAFWSTLLAGVIAFAAGFGRLSKNRVIRWLTTVYVEIFRGTSLLVQLFWLFYALPLVGLEIPPLVAGVFALGLNYGAYGSEVVRSSILAVPSGQTEASIALNMTPWLRMRRVILPQAFIMMIPSFSNLLIELLKGTSLISLITLSDLTFQGMLLRTYNASRTFEIFGIILVIYFLLAYPLTLSLRWLERRVSAGRV